MKNMKLGSVMLLMIFSVALNSQQLVISMDEYKDRVKAVWTAQMVGHFFGVVPFENRPGAVKWEDDYPEEIYKRFERNGGAGYMDDDYYYEIANLNALEKYGPGMTLEQLGQQWVENNVGVWGSSGLARKNLIKGIPAEWVGHPKYNRVWFTMGAMNRCDLYGMLLPGMPNTVASLSRRLGHINSYGVGTDGGIMVGSMISMAFYEKDPRVVLKKAVNLLDPNAPHRQVLEQVIDMAERGYTARECADAIMDRWAVIYPATNSAVPNFGMIVVALWFGGGDLMTTLNHATQANDYTDSDCNAASAAVVLAAMHGMKIFPEHLINAFGGRIRGEYVGSVRLTPPVDMSIDELADRTVAMGLEMIKYWSNGEIVTKGKAKELHIPVEKEIGTLPLELFKTNDFVKFWNPDWDLVRAGLGTPGGGFRGVRGGTHYDAENNVLATYPMYEIRNCYLVRQVKLGDDPVLELELAADPGRAWSLKVYVDNTHITEEPITIDGGEPLDYSVEGSDKPSFYPRLFPPVQEDYERSAEARKYHTHRIDLSKWAGENVIIRLYMIPIVWNRASGNAYWKRAEIL
jgi:hypothetical protein